MRINIACGKQTWAGFFCVDAVRHPKAQRDPDLLHAFQFATSGDLLNPLPLEDGCADEVHSYHFLEHVYRWEAPHLVAEFRRLLKPGGRLVLELPNIESAARNLLAGLNDQMAMWPLYGDPGHRDPYMCHRWGYTPATVAALLRDGGFAGVVVKPPITHGAKSHRDMRVEALAV
jgi:predicted SAM-dependent methyltransferase